ncbi:FAD:protein FMN transferase [Alicyclobacillus sp. SO9]|uniref:FAD:protein FMN transferase n=1 Tax=Alicyclobacillus sp. SO9 TaxID=2665646 RepID=UPI0018E899BC|nr:FAD:protein FMN transferase [Alicyclobacillus sp. SO9]QQE77814.1 FAD:protein FMN transferase [Alicyclobacillus sp. SO9]
MKQRNFKAMGTEVTLAAFHEEDAGVKCESESSKLLQAVEEIIVALERKLSRFIEGNELYRLNHSQGTWFDASSELTGVLHAADSAFKHSQGLFHPFLGTTIAGLGYKTSFHLMDRVNGKQGVTVSSVTELPVTSGGTPTDSTQSDTLVSFANTSSDDASVNGRTSSPLEWSEHYDNRVKLQSGYEVDLGGIAKGWIVEQAAKFLKDRSVMNFVIDAGGDMICSGSKGGKPWTVGIENPVVSGHALVLDLQSMSIATSGTYRRRWKFDGQEVHHIIDPRTLWSAQTDIVSASVLHPSLTEAEWMAKTLLIQGSKLGIEWLQKQRNNGWVVVLRNGEVRHAWM